MPEAALGAVLDARASELDEQQQRARRALLMRPLMSAGDPAFALVRAHADALRSWFARECGWTLYVERGHARLAKRPADTLDATRGAPEFNRERYVLLCLALAVLEREDLQITLARLGEALMAEALDDALVAAGFEFTLDRQSQRRDLVAVCRMLLELGVLARVAGDEAAYVQQTGDALYDIRRPVLADLLASQRGPSMLTAAATTEARLAALGANPPAEGEEARRAALRHRLARRLLDDPIVHLHDLTADERDYFSSQRGPMGRRLAEATGLVAEHRAEGSALVDERGELSDVALPQQGTDAHATLLLADLLAERLRGGQTAPLPLAEAEAFLRAAAAQHRKYWRQATQEPGAERELARSAIARLVALRLVACEAQTLRPLPAVCRFRLGEAQIRAQGELL